MSICGIYGIFNITTGKVLIGSSKDIQTRFRTHKTRLVNGKHANSHIQAAWLKYGREDFEVRVLEECLFDELIAKEDEWMDRYDSLDNSSGYNMRGATPRSYISEVTRRKMSESHKGGSISEEQRKKISIALKGRPSSRLGKHQPEEFVRQLSRRMLGNHYTLGKTGFRHSEESKRRMSIACTGRKHSEETKRKLSVSHVGKKMSEDNREKLRERMTLSNPFKGRKHSEESKARMSLAHKKTEYGKVTDIFRNGTVLK